MIVKYLDFFVIVFIFKIGGISMVFKIGIKGIFDIC